MVLRPPLNACPSLSASSTLAQQPDILPMKGNIPLQIIALLLLFSPLRCCNGLKDSNIGSARDSEYAQQLERGGDAAIKSLRHDQIKLHDPEIKHLLVQGLLHTVRYIQQQGLNLEAPQIL
ncbi:hypothetical protein FB451DRAFT_1180165 [Mycena latifolia]|nr:hypothetical protein FB451DRAFT_1180165 [Mycena latifolia]